MCVASDTESKDIWTVLKSDFDSFMQDQIMCREPDRQ